MTFEIRYTLNRASVILKLKQPLVDWLNSVDDSLGLQRLSGLDPLDEHGDIFLIPDSEVIESREDAVTWIEKRWRDFFEFALN